jgi:hypothetical protein
VSSRAIQGKKGKLSRANALRQQVCGGGGIDHRGSCTRSQPEMATHGCATLDNHSPSWSLLTHWDSHTIVYERFSEDPYW